MRDQLQSLQSVIKSIGTTFRPTPGPESEPQSDVEDDADSEPTEAYPSVDRVQQERLDEQQVEEVRRCVLIIHASVCMYASDPLCIALGR
jgi:hypothetical protein